MPNDEKQTGFLNGPKGALLYARVSSKDQKSIPDQFMDLRRYCELREWKIIGEFSDTMSGARDTRPGRYALMRQAMVNLDVNVVLVWKLDRWSRNTLDCLLTMTELEERRVAFVSLIDGLDLTTPMGRAMAKMLAVFAELERDTILQRVRAGVKKAKERGVKLGRPAHAREWAGKVRILAAQGKNKTEIAKAVGISRASVMRILKENPL